MCVNVWAWVCCVGVCISRYVHTLVMYISVCIGRLGLGICTKGVLLMCKQHHSKQRVTQLQGVPLLQGIMLGVTLWETSAGGHTGGFICGITLRITLGVTLGGKLLQGITLGSHCCRGHTGGTLLLGITREVTLLQGITLGAALLLEVALGQIATVAKCGAERAGGGALASGPCEDTHHLRDHTCQSHARCQGYCRLRTTAYLHGLGLLQHGPQGAAFRLWMQYTLL